MVSLYGKNKSINTYYIKTRAKSRKAEELLNGAIDSLWELTVSL